MASSSGGGSDSLWLLRRIPDIRFDSEPSGYNKDQVDRVLANLASLADELGQPMALRERIRSMLEDGDLTDQEDVEGLIRAVEKLPADSQDRVFAPSEALLVLTALADALRAVPTDNVEK